MFSPEHLHVALNHFPILGMPLSAIVALWGLLTKNRGTLRAGLLLLAVCAALTFVVMQTGTGASDAYDGEDFVDSDGYAWMTEHGERAARAAWAAYASGSLAIAAFVLTFFSEKFSRAVGALTIIVAALATGFAVWTADAGGKIRRPDFREKTPPTLSPTQHAV